MSGQPSLEITEIKTQSIYTKQCNMCHYLCMWILLGLSIAMCVVFGRDLNLHLKNQPFNELPECNASLNNQSQYLCTSVDSSQCIQYEVEFQTISTIFLQTIQCGVSECVNEARLKAVKRCGFIGQEFYFEDPNSKYPQWSKQTDTIVIGIFAPLGLIGVVCAFCIVYWCGGYNPNIKLPSSSVV